MDIAETGCSVNTVRWSEILEKDKKVVDCEMIKSEMKKIKAELMIYNMNDKIQ